MAAVASVSYHSSSLSSSMDTSLSESESESESSSSRPLFCPRLSGVAASLARSSAAGGGFRGRSLGGPGTAALKMLCCRSETSTSTAIDALTSLKVPSSFEMVWDFDFAYEIF